MQSKSIADLTEQLRELQGKEGLTDKQMAKRLGCSRQLWQMTRTGKTPLGGKILKCIFLAQSVDKSSRNGDRNPLRTALSGLRKGIEKVLRGITRG